MAEERWVCFAPFHPAPGVDIVTLPEYKLDRNDEGLVLAQVTTTHTSDAGVNVEIHMCRWHHDLIYGPVGGSV